MTYVNLIESAIKKQINLSKELISTENIIINNQKCIASTRDNTYGNFVYLLKRKNIGDEVQVVIEVYYGTTNGELSKITNLYPNVPFRIPIASKHFLQSFKFSKQPKDGFDLEWNPGLSVNSDDILTTTLEDTEKYYEINLNRNEITSLKDKYFNIYKYPSYDQYVKVSDTQCNILYPKITVHNEGMNDYITLSYIARVDLYGKFYHIENRLEIDSVKHLYWNVPFVVRFPLDKTEMIDHYDSLEVINRLYWTFGVDHNSDPNIDKIDNNIEGDISTKSYNYGFISHFLKKDNTYWANTWTTKCDADYYNGKIYIAGTKGVYNNIKKEYQTNIVVGVNDLNTNGYNEYNKSYSPKMNIDNPVTDVNIACNDNKLALVYGWYSPVLSVSRLIFYDITGGNLINTKTRHTYFYTSAPTVVPYKDYFLIAFYYKTEDMYILEYTDNIDDIKTIYNYDTIPQANVVLHLKVNSNDRKQIYKLFEDKGKYTSFNQTIELFKNININYNFGKIINVRPYSNDLISVDLPNITSTINSNTYRIPTTDVKKFNTIYDSNIYSPYDYYNNVDDYFYVTYKKGETKWITDKVNDYYIKEINLSGTITPEYWVNPVFQETDTEDSKGIRLILNITECSGLFTEGDISDGNAWDINLVPSNRGGIPLDFSQTRDDISVYYKGTKTKYQDQQPAGVDGKYGGGYSVLLTDGCDVKLTYNGNNILANTDLLGIYNVAPECWKYNQSGLFNMYLDLYLDLYNVKGDDGKSTFKDSTFTLTDCELSVYLKNKFGYIISQFEERKFTIDPPSVSGTISTDTYKIIDDSVSFDMIRDADESSYTYSTISDIKINYYDYDINETTSFKPNPNKYIKPSDKGLSEDIIEYINDDMDRGDYVYISYNPKLLNIKSNSQEISNSNYVSCCKNHKYNISNVKIEFSGITGWKDVTDNITEGNYFIYEALNTLNIRTSFTLDHESWPNRDGLLDHYVYPYISGMYVFCLPGSRSFESKYSLGSPYGVTESTYPNHNDNFALFLKSGYDKISSLNPDLTTSVFPGDNTLTSFPLSAYNFEMLLSEPGEYQIYALIRDEFDQYSCFCLSNINNNYNIPFRGQ